MHRIPHVLWLCCSIPCKPHAWANRILQMLASRARLQVPILLHKMSRTETVDIKVVGLHDRHPLLMCEGLELQTNEERVLLCLAQTTTG